MELALKFSALIALIAFTALVIFSIVAINRTLNYFRVIKSTFEKIGKDISIFRERLTVSLDELTGVNKKALEVMNEFDEIKVNVLNSLVFVNEAAEQVKSANKKLEIRAEAILDMFEPFRDLISMAYQKIAEPVNHSATFISAAYKAVTTFTGALKNRTNKNHR